MSLLWKTALDQIEAARPIPTKPENIERWHRDRPFWASAPHEQTPEEFASNKDTYWHGSPNGVAGLKVAPNGLHVGTQEAARQALNARIGLRADGKDWDGSQEYGKTLLAGKKTLADRGHWPTGYSVHAPDEDHHPTGSAVYGVGGPGSKVPLDVKPHLFPVRIVGGMSNPGDPHRDFHANGYMQAQIKQGRARNGYYYRNEGEDSGSISAVVPNADHLATHEDFVRHAHATRPGSVPQHNLDRYGLS